MSRFLFALGFFVIGCGTTVGGGGIAVGGGNVVGTPCNVAVKEGCLLVLGGTQRMTCVAGKWAVLEVCGLGTVCSEQMTAGEAAHTTVCAGAGDTAGASDATGDTTAGSDSAWIDDKKDGTTLDVGDSGSDLTPDVANGDSYLGNDSYADVYVGYDAYPYNDGYTGPDGILANDAYPYDGYTGYDSYTDYDGYSYDVGPYGDGYSYDSYTDYDGYGYDTNPYDGYTGYDSYTDYDGYSYDTASDPCVYNKPLYDPGCTSYSDATYAATLVPGSSAFNTFAGIVQQCTLTAGCLAEGAQCMTQEGKQVVQGKCVANCIVQQTGYAMSDNCAWCYGEYSGVCGFTYCLADCAVDATTPACQSCLANNCDPSREACKAGM